MESLQARELMAADFQWEGNSLRVMGTPGSDFISVQSDSLGTRVFTGETVHSEFQGRSFGTADSISVLGGDGHDVLMSYQAAVPVSLLGEGGSDFLFSDQPADHLEGGDGLDWVFGQQGDGVWENAFGIAGLEFQPSALAGVPRLDDVGRVGIDVQVSGAVEIAGRLIDVSGAAEVDFDGMGLALTGTLPTWEDAFGVQGLDLHDTALRLEAGHSVAEGNGYRIDLLTTLDANGTEVDLEGSVSVTPDSTDAALMGNVPVWEDAFGISGLELENAEVSVAGSVDHSQQSEWNLGVAADMLVDSTRVSVSGDVALTPDWVDVALRGTVEQWDNAMGIDGLLLHDAEVDVNAFHDKVSGEVSMDLDLVARADLQGTPVEVEGFADFEPEHASVSLSGYVPGIWEDAFGVDRLDLVNAAIAIAAEKGTAGSRLSVGVDAAMDLLGTQVVTHGNVEFTPEGIRADLEGVVPGVWYDAFGLGALQLKDTRMAIAADSTVGHGTSLEIDVATDVMLFGSYINVVGHLGFEVDGIDISFTPPKSIDFNDLFGIEGFTLSDADLIVGGGIDGLEVALSATMDMGNAEVDFEGSFAVGPTETSASLTGRIDEWDNAFDVAGLNLDDIVLTLGAASGPSGASMMIGMAAGIQVGSKEIDVAGAVGFSSTGWEVAFRGSVNSLTSQDLIGYANTITRASNPDAAVIPEDAIGDLELRDAYINFAPKGGHEALGIADGVGIGGEFFRENELLAAGEFAIDLAVSSFEVGLHIPSLDLGPVELQDVLVDIRVAASDSHFHVAGTAVVMGASVHLEGAFYSDGSFLVSGTGEISISGLEASATFIVDRSGVSFDATVETDFINTIKSSVTEDIRNVANAAQVQIDRAQTLVGYARAELSELKSELVAARAEAQREVDAIKAKLDGAQSIVDGARASRDYWYRVRSSRYSQWRSAVSATKQAPWYKYAYYKSIEAAKYSSYIYAASVYSTKVVAYNASVVAYNAIRDAAGWVLDTAGVNANPEVIRLSALVAAASFVVDTAENVLDDLERINAGVLQTLEIIDSIQVNRVSVSGDVSNYLSAGVTATINVGIGGTNHTIGFEASTDGLADRLGVEFAAAWLNR